MLRLFLLSVTMILAVSRPAPAGDWPEFRGPTGQGVADAGGVPLTWSETEHVTWKTPLEGNGWSSPAVVDGRIYLTSAVPLEGDGQSLHALCLDAETGEVVWDRELFRQTEPAEIHSKNSHASPSPVVAEGRVYVHFGPHGTACLGTDDGQIVWKNTDLKYGPTHGNGGSPALFDDLLVICCDGHDVQYVVGVETATGRIRWKTPRETSPTKGFSFSTPLRIEAGGRVQAVCPASNAVFSYDPATGREIWRVQYEDGYSIVPRPVFAGGLVFVCTGYNRPALLAIDPTGTGDVTATHIKWRTDQAVPHNPSPLAVGDELYLVSDRGVATCLDVKTGKEHWQQRLGGNFSASPTYADGRVYFQDENGVCIVVKAGRTFEELARNVWATEARTFASFAVTDEALILRSEKFVCRVE